MTRIVGTNFFENTSSFNTKYLTVNETKIFIKIIGQESFRILHLNIRSVKKKKKLCKFLRILYKFLKIP